MDFDPETAEAATAAWYRARAAEFAARTRNLDMSGERDAFTALVAPGGRVLDAGCGAGRDLRAFRLSGFDAEGVDPCVELAAEAASFSGSPTRVLGFLELEDEAAWDGIWCCASLLHVPAAKQDEAWRRLGRALRPGGVLYASYKAGAGERAEEGRFFFDAGKDALRAAAERAGMRVLSTETRPDTVRDGVFWSRILAEK